MRREGHRKKRDVRSLAEASARKAIRDSSAVREIATCLRDTAKLERAHGGCLGVERRRRTWTAAKSLGELRTSKDPRISEWDNPRGDNPPATAANLLN